MYMPPYLIPECVLDIPCLMYECVMLVSVSIRYAYFEGNCACWIECVMWVSVFVGYVVLNGQVCHVGECVYYICPI
jgi:hypothetical protein